VAFAQPPYTRYPSPDGGDGGDGGDVIMRADPNVATLLDFQYRHEFTAGRGGHGGANTKTGKRGGDLVIRVPVGTVLHDAATGRIFRDLERPGEQMVVAAGGRGGRGNATLAAARAATPRKRRAARADGQATQGGPGEARRIRLELKLIADVGIIGCPNAGKSSLLTRLSSARPTIGAYPFTTRYPVLGVVRAGEHDSFVACDIPGLIEGAHAGRGLGLRFLRHIERTRLLVHLLDMAAVDGRDPLEAFRQVNVELAAYSGLLARKPQLIVANKMDLPQARANLKRVQGALPQPLLAVSCVTGAGLPALTRTIWAGLQTAPDDRDAS